MKRRIIGASLILGLAAIIWLAAANPFNIFVPRSSHFALSKFRDIKVGMRIEDAISQLGEPVKVVKSNYDLGCPGCKVYYFMGDPPSWLLSFDEAWLLVDQQGRVAQAIENSEP